MCLAVGARLRSKGESDLLQGGDHGMGAWVALGVSGPAAEAHGQAALIGCVKLSERITHEQDGVGRGTERPGNPLITGRILLGAHTCIKPGCEQMAQVSGIAVCVEQLLGSH